MSDWITGIDHVQVAGPPGCEPEARRYYVELLGLKELSRPASLQHMGGCWFQCADGMQLHVGVQDPFIPARKAHPAFAIQRFDELRARMIDAGVEVIDDSAIAGVRRFFSYDPWGNRLEFVERLA
jgi:catechol 2,3-dioxygenase-like lactoylglutathione lyase family enzyme